IKKFKHQTLKQFGEGNEYDEKFWSNVIRAAIFEGLISKDIENYGILKITPNGKKYMDKPYDIKVVKSEAMTEDDDDEDVCPGKVEAVDKTLFNLLKELRKSICTRENIPPFVIFQDPSLEDMCNQYPTTIDELMHITGVGPGKAQKYGQEFVDLIRKYVEDNEIVRPQDFVVKSPINKSATKVFIIESIDRKLSFEDIARAKGMEMDELLTEIEKIVASGMRLNINYYIDEVIDPEHQEDILDYFNEAESDSVQAAVEALGEDEYPIEEIRIMRIKLMSDLGN
ncbi:MAG: HRDC domain-containing protein, partial [Bacteroidales bacterium]|nr:HRDC domain-containing protein [Bacteroidales bacterium]